MNRSKRLRDDDSAVSPVIGVILMVAVTVILAAVIGSFAIGLGDAAAEPAPRPTIDATVDGDTLVLDVTGGDDFEAGAATVTGAIAGDEVEFDMDTADANLTEVSAGDTIEFDLGANSTRINGADVTAPTDGLAVGSGSVAEWEIEIVWDPADRNSAVIYSGSS